MAKILAKGESVYECDTCKRRTRVPTNRVGLDIIQRCVITSNCQGKLHRIILSKDINDTPAFPPEVVGVQDWFQRKVLYTHEQTVQSAKWIVKHDLANKPNLYVYIKKYVNGVLSDVETTAFTSTVIDLNTIQLTFAQAERGLVQCITSASQNSTNQSATAGVAVADSSIQISTSGEITIATLDDAEYVNVMLTFNSPSSTDPVIVQYLAVGTPSVNSPWAGADYVVINGKQYRVRSFNIVTTQLAPPYFTSGAIASGSSITVSTGYKVGDAVLLLANAPYAAADRVHNKCIDAATAQTGAYLVYNEGTVYADPLVVKNIYPPIIVA